MSKKIFGGGKKKKQAEPEPEGPKVKPLTDAEQKQTRDRLRRRPAGESLPTILSDKLGL